MPVATPDLDVDIVVDSASETAKPYKVLLWNDPVNVFRHVIRVLTRFPFGMSLERAEAVTLQIHNEGKGVVAHADTVDDAQVYLTALEAASLWASLERD